MWTSLATSVLSIVATIVAKVWGPKPAPADDGLKRVRAGTEAAQAVDPSSKAVARDPDNLDA